MCQKRILVVDDEPSTIAFVTSVIEDMGDFAIFSAQNGDDGIKIAKQELPDLIILDVIMPKKDGFTTFCELKQDENTAHIPIIMLSGLHEMGDMIRGDALPVDARPELFVDKPIEAKKLMSIVDRILNKPESQ